MNEPKYNSKFDELSVVAVACAMIFSIGFLAGGWNESNNSIPKTELVERGIATYNKRTEVFIWTADGERRY